MCSRCPLHRGSRRSISPSLHAIQRIVGNPSVSCLCRATPCFSLPGLSAGQESLASSGRGNVLAMNTSCIPDATEKEIVLLTLLSEDCIRDRHNCEER